MLGVPRLTFDLLIESIQDVVKKNLCISCGACAVVLEPGAIELRYDMTHGMYYPHLRLSKRYNGKGDEFAVCPGKGYSIIGLSLKKENNLPNRNIELGAWHEIWAARSNDPEILENASSGGAITAIAEYLIKIGEVDGAIVTGIQYGRIGPRPKAYIATSRKELIKAQGSKYCPSPTLLVLDEVMTMRGCFVYIGTPCQIGGLRMLQKIMPELQQKIPFVIGNFCGGFRDYRETDTLIRREGFMPSTIKRFRYRGGGQPGNMLMESEAGEIKELPYPQYAKRTGYIKHRRCRLCVDATAELADFSCGDAWLTRFSKTGFPWSIVITRTVTATKFIKAMARGKHLQLEQISTAELKEAQRDNLYSKKVRQAARRRLFLHFGLAIPEFDGGFISRKGGELYEIKVILTSFIIYVFERIGLYPIIAKLIGRY